MNFMRSIWTKAIQNKIESPRDSVTTCGEDRKSERNDTILFNNTANPVMNPALWNLFFG